MKNKNLNIRISESDLRLLSNMAKKEKLSQSDLVSKILNDYVSDIDNMYHNYLKLIKKVTSLISAYQAYDEFSGGLTDDDEEILEILNIVYDLLIRSKKVINDKNLYVIDDEGDVRHKEAYSQVDIEKIKKIINNIKF